MEGGKGQTAPLSLWLVTHCWFSGSQVRAQGLNDGCIQLRWSRLVENDLMWMGWGHNLTLRTL